MSCRISMLFLVALWSTALACADDTGDDNEKGPDAETADGEPSSSESDTDSGADMDGDAGEVAAPLDRPPAAAEPVRPFEDLGELPEDVADAFEQMKLAILRHKAAGWQDISRDEMLGALDALKELAIAPPLDR